MKTHSDFFSFRKLQKMNSNSLSTKYSQLPTFIPKNKNFHENFLNNSKSKQNKRYFLNSNSNRIPNLKQKSIKSFSLNKRPIKLENCFHLSNSNFNNTDSLIKSNNAIREPKNLKLNSNTINHNHIKHNSKTMPKNETVIKLRTTNRAPFSRPKQNLRRFKLMNDINVTNNHDNLNNNLSSLKIDLKKKNNLRKNKNITTQKFSMQHILNEKYLTYTEARHSSNPYDVISAYGVNTYKGIIRNYNEDRVAIIVNAKKPIKFISNKNNNWPNVSFFGIFDGHAGNKCAEYLKNNLHTYILDSPHFPVYPIKAIQQGFQACENNYINSIYSKPFDQYTDYSGSCAIVVIIINNQCYIANLGDSRAIYSYNSGSEFFQLSRDHKPNDSKEKKRIYKAGGSIFKTNLEQFGMPFGLKETELEFKIPFRINPGRLAVSTFLII